ncbi:fimbria/pilus periplasmic chaperone [Ramlibacter sp. AN1015]|uniref:fimbrial biogenesis chaperone n=1 Tax=Ramlibacter sp. AN1015 TaxID=3133428 RepID=UPI0030C15F13
MNKTLCCVGSGGCWLIGLALLSAPFASLAGAFAVSPVRLEFGTTARSGAITVRNDDQVPLSFQVQAMHWSQDAAGKEHYSDASGELIYFPRLLTVAPGKEAVIRVGVRQPVVTTEKTFRLFIEELPGAVAAAAPGSAPQVRFLMRFGAPVHVLPPRPLDRLELQEATVADGAARWRLHNAGNQHARVESLALRGLDAQGSEVFVHRPEDRYLLSGQVRAFAVPLPQHDCMRLARLEIALVTERSELRELTETGPQPACS